MIRLAITILACLMFLVLGLTGDELLNLLPYKYVHVFPAPTQYVVQSFPLNNYYFYEQVSPVFCAAMLIVLLLTASKRPIIAPHQFAEGVLLVLILFGLYFGCFIWTIIVPFHLLGAVQAGSPPTILNITTDILGYGLWITVAALLGRIIFNRFRKTP